MAHYEKKLGGGTLKKTLISNTLFRGNIDIKNFTDNWANLTLDNFQFHYDAYTMPTTHQLDF